jgi:hypothetical protein
MKYDFTAFWFDEAALDKWKEVLPVLQPTKVIEVGSYEGRASTFLLESAPELVELYCIDTWQGGVEHRKGGSAESDMDEVYKRFINNINVALAIRKTKGLPDCKVFIMKDRSDKALAKLFIQEVKADLVYIDGSHQAPDVLCDAVLGWRLLGPRGLMIFDDYPWHEVREDGDIDILRCPKIAIDAFTQIYFKKFRIIPANLYQIYIQRKDED